METTKKINIQPTTRVYSTYKNLRYEPWTAIAEFVDNSTQSFFDHQRELFSLHNFKKLYIEIDYNHSSEGDILTIKDNAFGMEMEDFERAIKIDKPPRNTTGRNEFGMGLKTAACWFGNYWTITTTQLGSTNKYASSVDISRIGKTEETCIDCHIEKVDKEQHFTILTIKNLNKKITGGRTIGKVKSLLASIYRQDLRAGNVSIMYNGEELSFEEVEIYEELLPDSTKKVWKTDIDFNIEHENELLSVKGFVAIRKKVMLQNQGYLL